MFTALLALAFSPAVAREARPVGDIAVKTWPDSVFVTLTFDGDVSYRRSGAGERPGIVIRGARLVGPPVVRDVGRPPFRRLRVAQEPSGLRVAIEPGDGVLFETARRPAKGGRTDLTLMVYLPVPGEEFEAVRSAAERARAARRPVVVIDPGHGGIDSGTAKGNVEEKKVNLSVARAIMRKLREHGGVHVVATRTTDRFVTLTRRRHLAELLEADLFLSIHVNANADPRCSGFEIYRLSGAGSRDRATSLLEDRENMFLPGETEPADANPPDPTLAGILVDLKRERVLRESATAAESVRRRVALLSAEPERVKVRGGDFRVLSNLDTPALLLELGFVTNPGDRALLADSSYRVALGEAIAGAVLDYFGLPDRIAGRAEPVFRIVRVGVGDTVATLARAYGVSEAAIREAAGNQSLAPGRALVVPVVK